MGIITEITHYLSSVISSKENRSRRRSAVVQHRCDFAIETILKNLLVHGALG